MKKINKIIVITSLGILISHPAYAYSVRHHLINMGRNLVKMAFSPLYAAFIQAPRNIKETYGYEVWGREKPEKRGRFRYRLFAIWRSPAEATKAVLDGLIESVEASGEFSKEFLSIFFGD